jgi:hypothetical protein
MARPLADGRGVRWHEPASGNAQHRTVGSLKTMEMGATQEALNLPNSTRSKFTQFTAGPLLY